MTKPKKIRQTLPPNRSAAFTPQLDHDKRIESLIQQVREQKRAIASAERPHWKTNCSFQSRHGGQSINLQVETNQRLLVETAALLMSFEKEFTAAAAALGFQSDAMPPLWAGFPVVDWIHDIRLRLAKLQINERKSKLESLETRLSAIVSPEQRRAMELQEIERELQAE